MTTAIVMTCNANIIRADRLPPEDKSPDHACHLVRCLRLLPVRGSDWRLRGGEIVAGYVFSGINSDSHPDGPVARERA